MEYFILLFAVIVGVLPATIYNNYSLRKENKKLKADLFYHKMTPGLYGGLGYFLGGLAAKILREKHSSQKEEEDKN